MQIELKAQYCVEVGATAAKYVGYGKKCGFASEEAANAFGKNLGYTDWKTIRDNTATGTTTTGSTDNALDNVIGKAVAAGITGGITPGQTVGLVGLGLFAKALFAPKKVDPVEQQMLEQQQQLQLAADQLYKSGLYLLRQKNYTGAINEFQKALAKTPGDQKIINSLNLAKQGVKDTKTSGENSGALGQLIGNTTSSTSNMSLNPINNQPVTNTNSSVLNLVNLDSEPNRANTNVSIKPINDPPSKATDKQQAIQTLNDLLDKDANHDLKSQLDAFNIESLPQSYPKTEPASVEKGNLQNDLINVLNSGTIVAPGEDLKDAVAAKPGKQANPSEQNGQQEVNLGNKNAVKTLKPQDNTLGNLSANPNNQLNAASKTDFGKVIDGRANDYGGITTNTVKAPPATEQEAIENKMAEKNPELSASINKERELKRQSAELGKKAEDIIQKIKETPSTDSKQKELTAALNNINNEKQNVDAKKGIATYEKEQKVEAIRRFHKSKIPENQPSTKPVTKN